MHTGYSQEVFIEKKYIIGLTEDKQRQSLRHGKIFTGVSWQIICRGYLLEIIKTSARTGKRNYIYFTLNDKWQSIRQTDRPLRGCGRREGLFFNLIFDSLKNAQKTCDIQNR